MVSGAWIVALCVRSVAMEVAFAIMKQDVVRVLLGTKV